MKIIGTTAEGLLPSATEDEVANLLGYYGKYTDEFRGAAKPGTEIKVAAMYARLRNLDDAQQKLAGAAATLRGVADAIGPIQRVIGGAGIDTPKDGVAA